MSNQPPWEVEQKYSKNSFQVGPAWMGDLTDPDNRKWADLVSAAPELQAALKDVLQWICAWDPDFTHDPEWDETETKAKAALAKSEGRLM
jgi:hypothetical protein